MRNNISIVPKNHLWRAEEYHCHSFIQHDAAKHLIQFIQLKGCEHILDVGCGDGKISAYLAKCAPMGSVIGIDISLEMINFARKKFPKSDYPNLTFIHQDAQKICYHDYFEIVFSSFALQWFPDPCYFFKNVHKSLKASGYLVATIPLGISTALEEAINSVISLPKWSSYFHEFSPDWHFIPDKKYMQLLNDAHFFPVLFNTLPQIVIFSSRESFEKYVIQWFSYMNPLPNNLKQKFFTQIIDKYLEFVPTLMNGNIKFEFSRLDVIANKSIR